MIQRSPVVVVLLTCITFGIYGLVWMVKTKTEMNEHHRADIPTAWLLMVPFVNFWWMWRYAQGVDRATAGKLGAPVALLLLALLGVIGMAIIQSSFNGAATGGGGLAGARAA